MPLWFKCHLFDEFGKVLSTVLNSYEQKDYSLSLTNYTHTIVSIFIVCTVMPKMRLLNATYLFGEFGEVLSIVLNSYEQNNYKFSLTNHTHTTV